MWNMNDVQYSEVEKDISFAPSELPLPPFEQLMSVCCGQSFTIGITHSPQDEKRSGEEKELVSDSKYHVDRDRQNNDDLLRGTTENEGSKNTTSTQSTRQPSHVFTFNTGSIEFAT